MLDCEHDESQVSSGLTHGPEAFDMNICASVLPQDEDSRCPCTNKDGNIKNIIKTLCQKHEQIEKQTY